MNDKVMKAAIAELIGTFTLVFVGAGAVATAPLSGGVLTAALAHGLVLVGLIYAYGHLSGAHFNPAVTLAILVGRRINLRDAIVYWISQFTGGIVAGFAVNAITGSAGTTVGSLTADAVWTAALLEVVLTFFLVSAIFQAAVFGKAGNLAPVAIGLTLAGSILAGGVWSGASLNPARTLGPALAAGDLSYVIPYFVGIFAGAVLAALVHTRLLGGE